jgi:hypothetical protein
LRLDAIGCGTPAFIGDGGIESRHVDEARRLREHEGIIGDAGAVDLRVDGELADAGEALASMPPSGA